MSSLVKPINESSLIASLSLGAFLILPVQGLIADESLIHHWTFDEGSGSLAVDVAGAADGAVYGATWVEDRLGQAGKAIQTGYNMWVDPPNSVKTEVGTFSAWIYADAWGGYNQPAGPIFSAEQGSGGSNFCYRLQLNESGVIAFEAIAPWGNGSSRVAVSSSTIALSTWTHIAGTYDGYTSRVYINGQLDGSSETFGDYKGMNISDFIRMGIGHLQGWSVQWFQGRIDDARVYNTALSADDIQELVSLWKGYAIGESGWVDTDDWLGWVYVEHDPWIWIEQLASYVYFSDSGWMWVPQSP